MEVGITLYEFENNRMSEEKRGRKRNQERRGNRYQELVNSTRGNLPKHETGLKKLFTLQTTMLQNNRLPKTLLSRLIISQMKY